MQEWYPPLQGLLYFVPYALIGLFAGEISEMINRKNGLGIILILASIAVGLSGIVDSLFVFGLMRVVHGVLNSLTNPIAVSLIADYFPPERRTFANSLGTAGIYAGEGVASLSIGLIASYGWRVSYDISGAVGITFGLIVILAVYEPVRSRFEESILTKTDDTPDFSVGEKISSMASDFKKIWQLPVTRNNLIASFLRVFGGFATGSFLPIYFQKAFPECMLTYSYMNAVAVGFFGSASSIVFGAIADKLSERTYLAKTLIQMGGNFITPFLMAVVCTTGDFYLAIGVFCVKMFVHENFWGPTITMIQDTTPKELQANAISMFFVTIAAASVSAPLIVGGIAKWCGAP